MVELHLDKNKNTDRIFLEIKPKTKQEFQILNRIWKEDNVFEKKGCLIHAGASTQHGIENSDFVIEILKSIPNTSKVILYQDDWGFICDALEIAISDEVRNINGRFCGMVYIIEQLVKDIEQQSEC